jgi:hypothetical protein
MSLSGDAAPAIPYNMRHKYLRSHLDEIPPPKKNTLWTYKECPDTSTTVTKVSYDWNAINLRFSLAFFPVPSSLYLSPCSYWIYPVWLSDVDTRLVEMEAAEVPMRLVFQLFSGEIALTFWFYTFLLLQIPQFHCDASIRLWVAMCW